MLYNNKQLLPLDLSSINFLHKMIKILTGVLIFILGTIGLVNTEPIQMNADLFEHLETSQATPEISRGDTALEGANPQTNVENFSLVHLEQSLETTLIGLPEPVSKSEGTIGSRQDGFSENLTNTPQQPPENTSEPPTVTSESASFSEPVDEGNSSDLNSDTLEQQIYEIPIGLPGPVIKPPPTGESRNL